MSGKKPVHLEWREQGREEGRREERGSKGAAFRLLLSRTYLDCKTRNFPRARTMNWGILFVHESDLAGLFLSVEHSSDLAGGRAGSCSFIVPLGFLLKLKV